MRALVLGSLALLIACDSSPSAKPTPADKGSDKAATKTETNGKSEADAEPAPPPMPRAPAGTTVVDRVFVQTCAGPEGCPQMLQDAGLAHCKALDLAGLHWRLPRIEELERWRGNTKLVGFDVFHWSGSPWQEDPKQWWIYDPGSGSKTTAKPDRKPFTIRCVAAPT